MLKNLHLFFFSLGLLCLSTIGHSKEMVDIFKKDTNIILNGKTTKVYFNDGDTFKIQEGKYKGKRVRIEGLNALEMQLVHQWGDNSIEYLYEIALKAKDMAQKGHWNCELQKGRDVFGRLLATCDDLALALIGAGVAHAYNVKEEEPAKNNYLKKQRSAQKSGLGMWANGVPEHIITSLHSEDEQDNPYNRLISTKNGSTKKLYHHESYTTCEKVCIEQGNSCMVYVPYNERYGSNRPECLYLN